MYKCWLKFEFLFLSCGFKTTDCQWLKGSKRYNAWLSSSKFDFPKFAYRMCARSPTSAMPKSFLCCERAFCGSMVVMYYCALKWWQSTWQAQKWTPTLKKLTPQLKWNSFQAAAGPEGSAPPATLVPPQYGAYFCSSSMLEPLKRYGINPKTRSRDGFAVKLHQQAIADVLANSTLRGPQADTLLLVDIPSTRGSHTWTLTPNNLLSTHNAPIPSFHFHSAWQHPAQPMWTNPERYRSSSTPAQPTYFSAPVPTVREDILNVQADGRLPAHLRETPAPHILEEDAEPIGRFGRKRLQETTTAFQELLMLIDSNTRELPSVLSQSTTQLWPNFPSRSSENRVTWTLKFTLPAPAAEGATRRFSAVPRGYGPSGAHALEEAVRYAYPFDLSTRSHYTSS